jgi:hypothetical protein
MDESIFIAASGEGASSPDGEGERFTPTEHARGPWDPRALHGGAPAALIAAAFERLQPGAELRIARLGFEFLRPIPLAPLKLSMRIVRPGRRVQELAAELSVRTDASERAAARAPGDGDGDEEIVCRASALRVREIPPGVPESTNRAPAGEIDGRYAMGAPEDARPLRFALDGSSGASFAASAMEMRSPSPSPSGDDAGDDAPGDPREPGPGRVWMRLRYPLVAGEELTPLARLAASADFGNGISAVLPFDQFLFINADLTVHLQRPPRGEWIGLDAHTLLYRGGTGLAESVLHDAHGPVGRAFQTLVVEPR